MAEKTMDPRIAKLQEAMLDHQKKMQEDEAYRKRFEEVGRKMEAAGLFDLLEDSEDEDELVIVSSEQRIFPVYLMNLNSPS